MAEFRMPSLGADMVEGTLLQWLVRPGDPVHAGDVVAEVDTTKAAIEVECFDDGVIGEILVPEGRTVPVGTPLATIVAAGTPAKPTAPQSVPATAPPDPIVPHLLATPLVRKLAAAAGLDLATVHGTGPGGRIVRADVEPPAPAAERRKPAARKTSAPRRKARDTAARVRAADAQAGPAPRSTGGTRGKPGDTAPGAVRPTPKPPVAPDISRPSETPAADLAPAGAVDSVASSPSAAVDVVRPESDESSKTDAAQARNGAVPPSRGTRTRISGYARRLAAELGVDPSTLGTDMVRAADVRAAALRANTVRAEKPAGAATRAHGVAAGADAIPPTDAAGAARGAAATNGSDGRQAAVPRHDPAAVRKQIAAAMTRSKRTVPHYYLSSTIDMAAAVTWLRESNLRRPVADRVLVAALLARAAALAARKVPQLNGFWIDDEFRPADAVHLGMVVSLRGGGIIVPTVPGADTLDPPAMMRALRGAAGRARAARLNAADVTPATLTMTNLGELGVDSVFGVIAAPQVAIVGFGAVAERPCAVGGLLGIRPQVTATLSADHRASDGTVGARFLNTVSDLLQHPEEL